MMKRIVFLVSQLINSGPENVVFNICSQIDRRKFDPIIFSLKNEDPYRSIENKFNDIGVEIYHFGFSTLELELRPSYVAQIIQKKLFEINCDILHAHCYHPNLVACNLKGLKTITTVHQISGEDFVMKKGKVIGWYMKARFDRTLNQFNKVVVLSEYMREYYKDCAKELIKIPNGVYLHNNNLNVEAFRKEIGVNNTNPVVLVTGTLSDRKNVSYLLSELKRSKMAFNCFILGDGDKYEECLKIINNDSRFYMEGFKNNVADYLAVADLYISASKSEGLPMSVLEALNVGIPSLLSEIPPHIEIVEDMRVKGVCCFPLIRDGLRKKFEDTIGQSYEKQKIVSKAEKLYSSVSMAAKYQDLYNSILNN